MPGKGKPFTKADKRCGRPPGARNYKTRARDFVEFWRNEESDPDYQANAQRRIRAGRAPHLETLGIKLVHPEQTQHQITGKLVIEWES